MSEPTAPTASPDIAQHRFLTNLLEDKPLGELVALLLTKQPGQRIPSERELAETLHISRTALRDRISRLESLGILQRREREGTFLTGIQPDSISDTLILSLMSSQLTIDSLISVRYALERHAAMLACDFCDDHSLIELTEAVNRMQQSNDGRELFEADNDFHRALFRASGSAGLIFFSQMLHSVLRGTVRYIALENDRETLRKVHGDVLDAIVTGDRDATATAMDNHFAWLDMLRADNVHGAQGTWPPKTVDSRD